jgi:hypothetical protein
MSKEYTLGVYNLTFYKVDDDGEPLRNPDGSVKEFYVDWYDCSHLAEGITDDDLIEVPTEEQE